jgi:hypothetical protein
MHPEFESIFGGYANGCGGFPPWPTGKMRHGIFLTGIFYVESAHEYRPAREKKDFFSRKKQRRSEEVD